MSLVTHDTGRVGFIAGAFDLGPHAGHMMMLKECADNCDYLIVGLHIDPSKERKEKNQPVETAYERYLKLTGCKFVNKVIPYETEDDLYLMLINEKPHLRFLGDDYKNKNYTGKDITNVDVHFINRKHGFSSSGLRERIRGNISKPISILESSTKM